MILSDGHSVVSLGTTPQSAIDGWAREPRHVWVVRANGRLKAVWDDHDKAEDHAFQIARLNGPVVVMSIERVEVRS